MYCEAKGNIFKTLKNVLQESLGLASIRFWSLKMFKLWEEVPQNIMPYDITEWKYAW
jgi:hypothetical protein